MEIVAMLTVVASVIMLFVCFGLFIKDLRSVLQPIAVILAVCLLILETIAGEWLLAGFWTFFALAVFILYLFDSEEDKDEKEEPKAEDPNDWECQWCGAANPATLYKCAGCSHPR